jgi:hypothetical protein
MFIPDMLFSVINRDNAVVLFPDRSGNVYRFGKEIQFDPLCYPTWKVALQKVHELKVKPCAKLEVDPDSGEIGWVVLDKSLTKKEAVKLKQTCSKLTKLSLDPEKVAEDREKVAIMRYFVGKKNFQKLYEQAEEITQENNPEKIKLLFSGIAEEKALPDHLLAEFTAKKAEIPPIDVPSEEIFPSTPLFDLLTVEEIEKFVAENGITTIPSNAKRHEVFVKHCKKWCEQQTVTA